MKDFINNFLPNIKAICLNPSIDEYVFDTMDKCLYPQHIIEQKETLRDSASKLAGSQEDFAVGMLDFAKYVSVKSKKQSRYRLDDLGVDFKNIITQNQDLFVWLNAAIQFIGNYKPEFGSHDLF